jgi:predicted nucleotidyltransferase component of viral defense system
MKISREKLLSEAESTGFRTEILEKVIQLLNLLERLRSHPFLKGRFVLKGGTALNLFVFDVPRLSVDIDLNYIGSVHRETMLIERPEVEKAIRAVCAREGMGIRRVPEEHAGGKWILEYESALGREGTLQVDLNFMFRIPLWPIAVQDSRAVGSYGASEIPILDIHELAAGKLAALLARKGPRDLFDVHQLLARQKLDEKRLRLAFVAYGAMNRRDWRTVSPMDLDFDLNDLRNHLAPLLRSTAVADATGTDSMGRLVEECRHALGMLLPFAPSELEFLNRILERGEIEPSLLTEDEALAGRIKQHPLLQWKALNVSRYRQE